MGHTKATFSPKLSNTGGGDHSSAFLQCSPVVTFTLHIHCREKGILNVGRDEVFFSAASQNGQSFYSGGHCFSCFFCFFPLCSSSIYMLPHTQIRNELPFHSFFSYTKKKNPINHIWCLGLCFSSSQPARSLYSVAQRGVSMLCQLTPRLLAREVTVCCWIHVKNAWCYLLMQCSLNS